MPLGSLPIARRQLGGNSSESVPRRSVEGAYASSSSHDDGVAPSLLVETLAAPLLANAIRSGLCFWLLRESPGSARIGSGSALAGTRRRTGAAEVRSGISDPLLSAFARGSLSGQTLTDRTRRPRASHFSRRRRSDPALAGPGWGGVVLSARDWLASAPEGEGSDVGGE
jgi:hypothetical protein